MNYEIHLNFLNKYWFPPQSLGGFSIPNNQPTTQPTNQPTSLTQMDENCPCIL
jgi:hypothetical protein